MSFIEVLLGECLGVVPDGLLDMEPHEVVNVLNRILGKPEQEPFNATEEQRRAFKEDVAKHTEAPRLRLLKILKSFPEE